MWNIDYDFYSIVFHGSLLNEKTSQRFFVKAINRVDECTFNRLVDADIPLNAQLAACEVAECYFMHQSKIDAEAKHTGVKSENVGGYAVTYEDANNLASVSKALNEETYRIIKSYLSGTGLLNRCARKGRNVYEC